MPEEEATFQIVNGGIEDIYIIDVDIILIIEIDSGYTSKYM
jgi:hypothetical protein